jgi:HlyD family secretion protein
VKEIRGWNLTTRRRALSFSVVALSVFSIAALSGCGKKSPDAAEVTPAKTASVQSAAIQVSVTPVKIQPMSDSADVTGALAALNDVTVSVKIAGKMAAVYFREGDVVRAGQIVAQQDTADLQAQLDSQRANLLSAQTKLSQANVALTDAKTNLKLTQDQVESAIKQAQSGVSSANEQYTIMKQGARTQERQQAEENDKVAKSDVDSALSDRDKARKDLKRYQALARQGAIAPQQLDQMQAIADSADAHYLSAQSRYNSAVQNVSLIQEGNRPEDIRKAGLAVEQAKEVLVTALANRNQVNMRRADVENAQVGILSAKAGIEQSQATVRLAEQALRDASIKSPIDGIVAERKAEPGMQIAVTKPDVLRIVSLNNIYFDAQLTEAQFSEVRVGMAVAVSVDARPGKTFQGTVAKIFPVASAQARSFTVRITMVNENNLLRPQMFARGRIVLATHPNAHIVPRDAVLDPNGDSGRVFVVKDGKADERKVKLGFSNVQSTEVTSGLAVGDEVVTSGQGQIQPGDKVNVIKAAATSQP